MGADASLHSWYPQHTLCPDVECHGEHAGGCGSTQGGAVVPRIILSSPLQAAALVSIGPAFSRTGLFPKMLGHCAHSCARIAVSHLWLQNDIGVSGFTSQSLGDKAGTRRPAGPAQSGPCFCFLQGPQGPGSPPPGSQQRCCLAPSGSSGGPARLGQAHKPQRARTA